MLSSAVVVLAFVLPASPHAAAHQPSSAAPRVFVYTAEPKEATPTEEEQGRLDSVRDVREALGRKAGLVMVSSASGATVLVEVVGREKRDAAIGGFGGTTVTPQGETIVRLHLKYGEQETDIKGVAPGYWARAAKDAADRALKWIARVAGMPGKGKKKTQRSVQPRAPSTSSYSIQKERWCLPCRCVTVSFTPGPPTTALRSSLSSACRRSCGPLPSPGLPSARYA
jgi:hypothetical protein